MDREEILTENRDFYCKTYYLYADKVQHCIMSCVFLILAGSIIWLVKERFILSGYMRKASYQLLDGEVLQWAKEQMQGVSAASTLGLAIGFGIFALYIVCMNLFVKNYELYKKRVRITIIPFSFVVILGLVLGIYLVYDAGGTWKLIIIELLISLIPATVSRLLITAEAREPDNFILKWIEILANYILKKM